MGEQVVAKDAEQPPTAAATGATAWPFVGVAGVFAATAVALVLVDRPLWCACGEPKLLSGDASSRHNSQHLFDPYSLTHLLKGLAYCGLLGWAFPRLKWPWQLCLAVGLEAVWELIENSPPVIERYRTRTLAQGYTGDTLANALADVFSAGVGFLLARRIGLWPSVGLFVVTELMLLFWMRDNLTLSTVTLFVPLEAIKNWQTGG